MLPPLIATPVFGRQRNPARSSISFRRSGLSAAVAGRAHCIHTNIGATRPMISAGNAKILAGIEVKSRRYNPDPAVLHHRYS
jgi:hypothetical protein